jgi:hypothetical protein
VVLLLLRLGPLFPRQKQQPQIPSTPLALGQSLLGMEQVLALLSKFGVVVVLVGDIVVLIHQAQAVAAVVIPKDGLRLVI